MVEPLMQSPLHVFGLDAMATPINDSKGAWVHEIPFLGYISLRGNSSDALFMNAATSALGRGRHPRLAYLIVHHRPRPQR